MKLGPRALWTVLVAAGIGACTLAAAGTPAPAPPAAARVEYDKLKLPELLRRAQARDARAQFELGARFNYGRGVPKNSREALRWLRQAADRGLADAQRLLAVKLYNGYGIAADEGEAMKWAQRLAESGDVPGQMMLANMYANGEGGPRHLVRAYMWYAIAAATAMAADDAAAAAGAAELRDKSAALLLPEEEAEAQRLASDWWLRKQGIRAPRAFGNAAARPAAGGSATPVQPAKPPRKQP